MRKSMILFGCAMAGIFPAGAEAEDYSWANPQKELAKIPWLQDTARSTDRVWQTKYDPAKPETPYEASEKPPYFFEKV
jgi:hypothetical protein